MIVFKKGFLFLDWKKDGSPKNWWNIKKFLKRILIGLLLIFLLHQTANILGNQLDRQYEQYQISLKEGWRY